MIKYYIFFLSLTITENMAAGLTFAEKGRLDLERRREAKEIADANKSAVQDDSPHQQPHTILESDHIHTQQHSLPHPPHTHARASEHSEAVAGLRGPQGDREGAPPGLRASVRATSDFYYVISENEKVGGSSGGNYTCTAL